MASEHRFVVISALTLTEGFLVQRWKGAHLPLTTTDPQLCPRPPRGTQAWTQRWPQVWRWRSFAARGRNVIPPHGLWAGARPPREDRRPSLQSWHCLDMTKWLRFTQRPTPASRGWFWGRMHFKVTWETLSKVWGGRCQVWGWGRPGFWNCLLRPGDRDGQPGENPVPDSSPRTRVQLSGSGDRTKL